MGTTDWNTEVPFLVKRSKQKGLPYTLPVQIPKLFEFPGRLSDLSNLELLEEMWTKPRHQGNVKFCGQVTKWALRKVPICL